MTRLVWFETGRGYLKDERVDVWMLEHKHDRWWMKSPTSVQLPDMLFAPNLERHRQKKLCFEYKGRISHVTLL